MKEIVYHRTTRKNLNDILKNGLLKKHSHFWKGAGGCIYLSRESMTNFGEVLLEVDVTGLDTNTLSDWEIICWDDIPSKKIKVKK